MGRRYILFFSMLLLLIFILIASHTSIPTKIFIAIINIYIFTWNVHHMFAFTNMVRERRFETLAWKTYYSVIWRASSEKIKSFELY